ENTHGNDALIRWSSRHHDGSAVCRSGPASRAAPRHSAVDAAGNGGSPPDAAGDGAGYADGRARVSVAAVASRRVSGGTPELGRGLLLAGSPGEGQKGKDHVGTQISDDGPRSWLIQQRRDFGGIRHIHRGTAPVAPGASQWRARNGGGAAQSGALFRAGTLAASATVGGSRRRAGVVGAEHRGGSGWHRRHSRQPAFRRAPRSVVSGRALRNSVGG